MPDPVPALDLVPTTPVALAALMYEAHIPGLWDALVRRVGDRDVAARLWWQAADLLETHHPIPRKGVRP